MMNTEYLHIERRSQKILLHFRSLEWILLLSIHTQKQYFVASRKFELPELKLLIDAVESSKFITKKKSETLIEKIHTMTSPGQVAKLKRNNYVVNRIKPDNEQIYYIIDAINDASIQVNRFLFSIMIIPD